MTSITRAYVRGVPWWRRLLALLRVPRIDRRRAQVRARLLALFESKGLPPPIPGPGRRSPR